MDLELQKLNDSRNLEDLRKYVSTLSSSFVSLFFRILIINVFKQISTELSKIVWKNDGAAMIQTLFNGLSMTETSLTKKLQVWGIILCPYCF